ncbi:endonuclease domain-containing 1 protein-like [Scomber scombrus]|uniref:endonuclease domain-containing 1 protein-like n=1 Tax=Scomber scombrus TaxID=13677 RepID=UPI002DD7C1C9|nr:endonuclease domain-containing 1 protein-like [Scomber scombrus]
MKLLVSAFLLLALGYLATAEVLPSSFQKCNNFFLKKQPPTGPAGPQYKKICQKRDPAAGYEFATLYDTNLRIPIYSAYEFQSKGSCSRTWYIEPQLDDPTKGPEMVSEDKVTKPPRGDNQALNGDYPGTDYVKGHLVPVRHRNAQACSEATFTLTNVAPQNRKFNQGAWSTQKGKVSDDLTDNCLNRGFHAYIVTGVVPGNNPPINGRVNIPDYFWSAYCCVNNNNVHQLSGAYYGKNDITNTVATTTVANLNAMLQGVYGTGFSVFGNNC